MSTFMPLKQENRSVVKVSGVSNKRTVVRHLHEDKSDDVEVTC